MLHFHLSHNRLDIYLLLIPRKNVIFFQSANFLYVNHIIIKSASILDLIIRNFMLLPFPRANIFQPINAERTAAPYKKNFPFSTGNASRSPKRHDRTNLIKKKRKKGREKKPFFLFIFHRHFSTWNLTWWNKSLDNYSVNSSTCRSFFISESFINLKNEWLNFLVYVLTLSQVS